MKTDRIILGIDPGTTIMGYGLIHDDGCKPQLLHLGFLQLSKYSNQGLKLKKIFERSINLIDEYHPDIVALEAPFYGKNVQSMLKLGRAQGVAMAAALYRDIEIVEYSPKRIKQAITGNGNASKEQVCAMLLNLLNFTDMPKHLDATDGLAVAVCHYFQKGTVNQDKHTMIGSWASFLKQNPERLL